MRRRSGSGRQELAPTIGELGGPRRWPPPFVSIVHRRRTTFRPSPRALCHPSLFSRPAHPSTSASVRSLTAGEAVDQKRKPRSKGPFLLETVSALSDVDKVDGVPSHQVPCRGVDDWCVHGAMAVGRAAAAAGHLEKGRRRVVAWSRTSPYDEKQKRLPQNEANDQGPRS